MVIYKVLPDVVLGGERVKDGDSEGNLVALLAHHLLGQQPGLRVVHVLILRILHPDVPLHGSPMRPILPLKPRLHAQHHPQH